MKFLKGAIDANLLLYAADKSSPYHTQALTFLTDLFESGSPVYVTWDALHAFFRIATNPSIFSNPLSPKEAASDIQKMLDHPDLAVLSTSHESWAILARLATELHLRGNLIPDAVTASILEANGIATIYTHDRDFWKFPSLKPIDPFEV